MCTKKNRALLYLDLKFVQQLDNCKKTSVTFVFVRNKNSDTSS